MKGAERFKKTAVIRKPAVGTGIKHTATGDNLTSAVLHAQIIDVIVNTLHRVLFEGAGEVLSAGEEIFCERGGCEIRVGVVVANVFDSVGDQRARGTWICFSSTS